MVEKEKAIKTLIYGRNIDEEMIILQFIFVLRICSILLFVIIQY